MAVKVRNGNNVETQYFASKR